MSAAKTLASTSPLKSLRLWQRCSVHMSLLYGLAIVVALLFLANTMYKLRTASELEALQKRLQVLVTVLSEHVDKNAIAQTALDYSEMSPAHESIRAQFVRVMEANPELESLYVLRQTEEPTQLRFFVDVTRDGDAAKPGEKYDASRLLVLLQGFSRVVVEKQPYRDAFGSSLSAYAPIRDETGRSIGLLGADVSAEKIYAVNDGLLRSTVWVFGGTLLVLALLTLVVARNIRKPLEQIIAGTSAIAEGNFSTRIDLQRKDEFGIMAQHIDRMAAQLQQREFIRQIFGQYVSEAVAEKLLTMDTDTTLSGEERVVSVLFSDLQAYSSISEHLPPVKLVELLNHYFGEMTLIIERHGGCVIEFLGDGILVVFGAPQSLPNHAEQAVRCALAMYEHFQTLLLEWQNSILCNYVAPDSQQVLGMRMGVHSGAVVAGNLGCASRMKYAVIGDTVNVASRLEILNKEFQTNLLISGDTAQQLPIDLSQMMSFQGMQKIKGRDGALPVYSL
ncbi:MAG TPA: adenylate/guanylate cyclase domain-containing protein [Pseudomonadales bacterium]|nr:adenylate/guanylate cyclase domain-containing protein [Pseudomonadales bacterium]